MNLSCSDVYDRAHNTPRSAAPRRDNEVIGKVGFLAASLSQSRAKGAAVVIKNYRVVASLECYRNWVILKARNLYLLGASARGEKEQHQ
jgi:hypothetical protein